MPAPRLLFAALALTLALTSASSVAAAPLRALYVAHEEETRWEPIARGDIELVVEHAALEVLTRAGLLQLEKVAAEDLDDAKGDYLVRIIGRMVSEAESHTVHLSFGPRDRADVGSFRAADTVVVGKLPRDTMRRRIEDSTRRAAEQLAAVLTPALARLAADAPTPPATPPASPPPMPWVWGEVRVPEAPPAAVRELWGKDREGRDAVLRQLTAEALASPGPRHALERCALEHPEAEVRLRCLIALRPSARRLIPTQRVVIEAFRKDADARVIDEASEQMLYFPGMSHAEAVQAWLERTADDGVQRGPVKELGDVDNLDLVIARCLWSVQKRPEYERSHRSCIELTLPLPGPRRRAVLWPYLQESSKQSAYYLRGAGAQERSHGTDWQWALEAVADTSCTLDAALEDVAWRRYERELSATAIELLGERALPSERLVQRLVQAAQTGGERAAVHGLLRVAELAPALRPLVRERIAELVVTGSYHKDADLERLQRDLARLEERAAPR